MSQRRTKGRENMHFRTNTIKNEGFRGKQGSKKLSRVGHTPMRREMTLLC